jgi:glycosyltransferase involved in cell wall biosynthesis
VVVQALLTEVPAVSFDNDGAPEVVIPNKTGVLVPLGDTNGLAAGMTALARDPALRARLGAGGRALCLQRFDWRGMVERLEAVYAQVVSKASG